MNCEVIFNWKKPEKAKNLFIYPDQEIRDYIENNVKNIIDYYNKFFQIGSTKEALKKIILYMDYRDSRGSKSPDEWGFYGAEKVGSSYQSGITIYYKRVCQVVESFLKDKNLKDLQEKNNDEVFSINNEKDLLNVALVIVIAHEMGHWFHAMDCADKRTIGAPGINDECTSASILEETFAEYLSVCYMKNLVHDNGWADIIKDSFFSFSHTSVKEYGSKAEGGYVGGKILSNAGKNQIGKFFPIYEEIYDDFLCGRYDAGVNKVKALI
jgi:hypothetical protein